MMTEVFITNIREASGAEKILRVLTAVFPELQVSADLNGPGASFPCGHSILRVEGPQINAQGIRSVVKDQGFLCDVLEDKICT